MPICVYDVTEDGTATVPDSHDLTGPARYRWWHFDLSDPNLRDWCESHLPEIPAGALLQPETRPRCDTYEDGLILNLRAINMNAGQHAEKMVSIRMWVTDSVIITYPPGPRPLETRESRAGPARRVARTPSL